MAQFAATPMPAAIPVLKPISQLQLQPGSVVTVADLSWDEFEAILQEMGHRRASRIAYSGRMLQIMAPLPEHEISRDVLSDLVKLLLRRSSRMYEPFGSTTFRREGVAGVEPDACFYIQNSHQMLGRRRLEPTDPPPDLAIETDLTSNNDAGRLRRDWRPRTLDLRRQADDLLSSKRSIRAKEHQPHLSQFGPA